MQISQAAHRWWRKPFSIVCECVRWKRGVTVHRFPFAVLWSLFIVKVLELSQRTKHQLWYTAFHAFIQTTHNFHISLLFGLQRLDKGLLVINGRAAPPAEDSCSAPLPPAGITWAATSDGTLLFNLFLRAQPGEHHASAATQSPLFPVNTSEGLCKVMKLLCYTWAVTHSPRPL